MRAESLFSESVLGDFLHELAHEVLHVDGKILRSVQLLVTAPGSLTKAQFAGHRTRYVSPIRLYLTFSVLYFAVAALAPGVSFRVTVGGSQQRGLSFQRPAEERLSSPEELRKLGYESQQELESSIGEAVVHWTPRALFLLVPIFGAMIGWTVRQSGRNYPQQLYFALHVHAAWFLMLAIATAARFVPWRSVSASAALAVAVWMLVYLILALRHAYSVTIGGAIWRGLVVSAAYGLLLMAAIVAIVLPVVLRHR